MKSPLRSSNFASVALLAEGVDRNFHLPAAVSGLLVSPSSRRAWIEIDLAVAITRWASCRPPRGGRG